MSIADLCNYGIPNLVVHGKELHAPLVSVTDDQDNTLYSLPTGPPPDAADVMIFSSDGSTHWADTSGFVGNPNALVNDQPLLAPNDGDVVIFDGTSNFNVHSTPQIRVNAGKSEVAINDVLITPVVKNTEILTLTSLNNDVVVNSAGYIKLQSASNVIEAEGNLNMKNARTLNLNASGDVASASIGMTSSTNLFISNPFGSVFTTGQTVGIKSDDIELFGTALDGTGSTLRIRPNDGNHNLLIDTLGYANTIQFEQNVAIQGPKALNLRNGAGFIFYATNNDAFGMTCNPGSGGAGNAYFWAANRYDFEDGVLYNRSKRVQTCLSGPSSERPSDVPTGFMYFDTNVSLNKPIWWNGSNWVDASGSVV